MRCPAPLCLLSTVLLVAAAAGCDGLPGEASVEGDLVERLERQRDFQTLAAALRQAGLDDLLRADPPRTVLAPTGTAFEYLGADFLAALRRPDNAEVLARVLRHHVIEGHLGPDDFVDGDTLRSIDGRPLPVRRLGPVVRVGGVTLDLTTATEAEGSVAYGLTDVLLGALTVRERVRLSPSLSQFALQAQRVGLFDRAAGPVTVLAPLDDAFLALGSVRARLFDVASNADVARRALDAHLVPGTPPLTPGVALASVGGDPLAVGEAGGVRTVGGRRILREEVLADGRLLVLGGVVLETLSVAQRLRIEPTPLLYPAELRDRLPALWARLQDDAEAVTLFAPTDLAYQRRGAALNNALTDAPNAALNRRLLRVHAVEGRYGPDDLVDGLRLTTTDGTVLAVGRDGDTITLDGRRLSDRVGPASNGVLYLMDAFLAPAVDALDSALLRGFTEHVTAVRRAGLEAQFRAPGVTAFLASDSLYLSDPGRLLTNPRPFLLYNATAASIPSLGTTTFTALDGTARSIRVVPCPDGSDPEVPEDRACSPYQLPDRVQVYQGNAASDGTGYLHTLRKLSYPPGY